MTDVSAFNPNSTISFVIRNNSSINRSIKVFNTRIAPGATLDLMRVPGVTEEDIRSEVTKGPLRALFAGGSLVIVSSTVSFHTADVANNAFLAGIGVNSSAGITSPSTAITQTAIFIDPQNSTGLASDENSGTSAAAPLLTIGALASRYGTTQPEFSSPIFTVTVNLLSDTKAADPWNFRPLTGIMVVVASLTQQTTGVINTFTARNQAAATKASINTTSFGSWTPYINMWVQDTTTASWFTVESDSGGGSAVVTQPAIDTRSSTGAVNPNLVTPLTSDNFTVWRPGIVHVSTTGSMSANATVIIQNANITPVLTNGQADFYGSTVLQQCISSAYVTAAAQLEGNNNNSTTINNAKPFFSNCVFLKGMASESHFIYGGSVWGPFVLRAAGVQAVYGGGVYFNGTVGPQSFSSPGKHQFGDCGFFNNGLNLLGAGNGRQGVGVVDTGTDAVTGATAAVWGTSAWPIKSGGIHMCKTSFTAELKVTGLVTLAGASTAASFTAATGAYSANTAITIGTNAGGAAAANIDAAPGGGVYDPQHMCGMFKEA